MEKAQAFHLNKLKSLLPKDALCQVWLKLVQWFWRRRCLNFVNVFSLFCNYLPLEKAKALHLNKLESPSPKDAFCRVWLKLVLWFWRRRFLNFVNLFLLFLNYLRLEKAEVLHLNKLEFPLHKDALRQVWLKLVQWFWRRWKCEKFTTKTDKFWSGKLTWAFGEDELKKVTYMLYKHVFDRPLWPVLLKYKQTSLDFNWMRSYVYCCYYRFGLNSWMETCIKLLRT